MAEQYPYPPQEHYEVPRSRTEQAEEELRLYPEASEFAIGLRGLRRMYEGMPCMQAIERYALIAGSLREDSSETVEVLNRDFYNGALMGIHVNLAPASLDIKRKVLQTHLLENLDDNPMKNEIVRNIALHIEEWASSKKNNWRTFLDTQDRAYRDIATELSLKLYEDTEDAEERQLDFIVGFTYATNLVWQIAGTDKVA